MIKVNYTSRSQQSLCRFIGIVLVCVFSLFVPRVSAAETHRVGVAMRYTSTYKGIHTHHRAKPVHIGASSSSSSSYSMHSTNHRRRTSVVQGGVYTSMPMTPARRGIYTQSTENSQTNPYTNPYASTYSAVSSSIHRTRGIQTSASAISGGMLAAETYSQMGGGTQTNTSPNPGVGDVCDNCPWEKDENGNYYCPICECDVLDGCNCNPCHCNVPLDGGWETILFFTLIAAVYTYIRKHKAQKETVTQAA